ncbi:MAG TPA: carboxypeptidase regulatory-like domain-containing protein [Polyangiaceae bacterium]|jgi:plastocyanin
MIAILNRPSPRSILALVAAASALACNAPPAPASPVAGASSPAAAAKPPTGPRIVGLVVATSTGSPVKSGGVVYLEDAPKEPGEATSAAIDVHHKEFTPFISVITAGGTVTFGNQDALTHHVFSPDLQEWDTGYLRKGDTAGRRFDALGAVAFLCNIHPEMIGYLLVIPSTYFGRVGDDGRYVIAHVPPGTYKATAWAPRMPTTTQSVTVGSAGAVTANFELRPADRK